MIKWRCEQQQQQSIMARPTRYRFIRLQWDLSAYFCSLFLLFAVSHTHTHTPPPTITTTATIAARKINDCNYTLRNQSMHFYHCTATVHINQYKYIYFFSCARISCVCRICKGRHCRNCRYQTTKKTACLVFLVYLHYGRHCTIAMRAKLGCFLRPFQSM